jgi:hypothetical protein
VVVVDPLVGTAPIALNVEPSVRHGLATQARGRPLVIDYYACVLRGQTVGDLTIRFELPPAEPRYVELEALDGVSVIAERSLIGLLIGATIREGGLPLARHLAISLDRPEQWIEFLEHHPAPRRVR